MKRNAFTLIEVLVVIAIIGIVMSMILPAVQSVRESARRVQCLSNLAQVGIALQNYEAAHEVMPPGVVGDKEPVRNSAEGRRFSWITSLLPYLDRANVYARIDFSATPYDKRNVPVRRLSLATLLCPSDPNSRMLDDSVAHTSYAGCHHHVEAPIDANNSGVLYLNSAVRSAEIPDGRSYTLLAGEKLIRADDLGWMSGTRATLRNTGRAINEATRVEDVNPLARPDEIAHAIETNQTREKEDAADAEDDADENENEDDVDWGTKERFVTLMPTPLLPSKPAGDESLVVGGFASVHVGLANFLFVDGTTRTLSQTINLSLYQKLGHRSDGQLLDERALE